MPDVLVLAHDYTAVDIVDWERAVVLLYEDKVDVLETYIGKFLRSPSTTIEMPAVIRFKRPHTKRRQVVRFSREAVWSRDDALCGYCNTKVPYEDMTIDHVLPRTLGGKTEWTNVVTCCSPCNTKKGGRTPQQAGMRLRTQPYKPKTLSRSLRRNRFAYREGMPDEWKNWLGQEVK